MNRIDAALGVGNVPLRPLHLQCAAQGAAPSVLDRVAESHFGRRLADNAGVDGFSAATQLVHDSDGAIGRFAFLVRGQEDGNRAWLLTSAGGEPFDRRHECGHGSLHVRGTAAVQPAAALHRPEGIAAPQFSGAGRDDVDVAGKAEHRSDRAPTRPEVAHARAIEALTREIRQARAGTPQHPDTRHRRV